MCGRHTTRLLPRVHAPRALAGDRDPTGTRADTATAGANTRKTTVRIGRATPGPRGRNRGNVGGIVAMLAVAVAQEEEPTGGAPPLGLNQAQDRGRWVSEA